MRTRLALLPVALALAGCPRHDPKNQQQKDPAYQVVGRILLDPPSSRLARIR